MQTNTVILDRETYDRLKETSEFYLKLTTDPKHCLVFQIPNRYRVKVVTKEEVTTLINEGMAEEISTLTEELSEANKKLARREWWQKS